ncbi:Putative protein of unknown function [Podospora comata]|uniref:Uncharacterized protein n=1 Tax=Podospora comata TaxID=48703 RepID=A0ABY6RXZ0_PODCO|nr:Putative protein of unknown function [Podospora comata]
MYIPNRLRVEPWKYELNIRRDNINSIDGAYNKPIDCFLDCSQHDIDGFQNRSNIINGPQQLFQPRNRATVECRNHWYCAGKLWRWALSCRFRVGSFFFLRRKRRSKPDNHPILPDKATSETPVSFPRPLEGKTTHSSVLAAGRSPGLTLHSYLLDGPGDSEVGSEFHDLEFLLKSHVEDCYHEKPVSYGLASIKQSLEGLGLDEWTQEQIAKSSLDPRQRHAAIRSFMSRVIFSALDIQSISGHSLLPPEVVAFVKALPPTVKSQSPGSPTTQVLDMWRRCSAFLLHEDRQERTLLPPPQGSQWQVKELQRALDKFLVHFLDEHTQVRQNQGEDLNAVIQEFVKFGYAVFSHSCSWRYSFEAEHTCWSKGIVIMPGLERLTRRNGEVLEKPEVVVPPLFENTR